MNVLLTILKVEQLLGSLVLPTLEEAARIKALFSLDPDYQVNVAVLTGDAVADDNAFDKMVEDWRSQHRIASALRSPQGSGGPKTPPG